MKNISVVVTLLLLATGIHAQTQQEWRDSVSVLSALIERNPRDVTLRLRKAAVNIELGQWNYALDEYSNVLTIEPQNLTALYYRAFANYHLGRYSFARQDYENVIIQEPMNRHALMGLILTNLADKHITQAFDGANRLVDMAPESAEVWAVRAEVEAQLDMTDAAVTDIETAIKIEDTYVKQKYPTTMDDDITSYQLLAFTLYMKQGKKNKARQSLDYLIKNGLPKVYLKEQYAALAE